MLSMKEKQATTEKKKKTKKQSFQKGGGDHCKTVCLFIKSGWVTVDCIFVMWFNSPALKLEV